MGDNWQFNALVDVMLDSWPMLKKCQHELRDAVSKTKFSVHPYALQGKKPTKRAQEKANLVLKAMESFRPHPAVTDERAFSGMVYDLTNSFLVGLTACELQWYKVDGDILPRTATFVHPAHLVLDNNAVLQIANMRDNSTQALDPNFFLTSFFQSQSGSVYAMGMVRSVGWWWAVLLSVQQWMFGSAQKYGSPYIFLTYARDLVGNIPELDKIEEALEASGTNRWGMAPEGCEVDMKPPGTMGSENPQRYMKEQADREVQMLFLGQTSSTSAEPGRLGNNDQHMEVRQERKEGVAKWVGEILTAQFGPAILRRNYGEDNEAPTISPDFTEVESRKETADRMAVVINTGIPIVAEELYDDLNLKVPEEGDQVVQRGQLGIMSNPAETPIQPGLDQQIEDQHKLTEASGEWEEPGGVQARGHGPKNVKASSYVGDISFNKLPDDVAKDVERFVPEVKASTKLARYGMTVNELRLKVDPHNFSTAMGHCEGQEQDRDEFESRRDGKYILIVNDRIVDGHHFLAKAECLGITSSLNVLDLTPARFQVKTRQVRESHRLEAAGAGSGHPFYGNQYDHLSVREATHQAYGFRAAKLKLMGLGHVLSDWQSLGDQRQLMQTGIRTRQKWIEDLRSVAEGRKDVPSDWILHHQKEEAQLGRQIAPHDFADGQIGKAEQEIANYQEGLRHLDDVVKRISKKKISSTELLGKKDKWITLR